MIFIILTFCCFILSKFFLLYYTHIFFIIDFPNTKCIIEFEIFCIPNGILPVIFYGISFGEVMLAWLIVFIVLKKE